MPLLAVVVAVMLAAASGLAATAPAARAADAFPCGKATEHQLYAPEPVQLCPLTHLPPEGAPLYLEPVPGPAGAWPRPTSWVRTAEETGWFVCDRQYPEASFVHPQGWRNSWWAYTRAANGVWGWVPEAYFHGGENDEPDAGLRRCPPPPPPPPPAPPPDPCEALPAADGLRLQALVGQARRITRRWGRQVTIRGTLTSADGWPLAGASLCVLERTTTGAGERQIATLTTGADGRFELTLDAGTSRRLRFTHRVGDTAAAADVAIDVRAPLALRADRRTLRASERIVLSGHLRGAPRQRGVLVELQARRGRRYQTFATTRTSGGGRFRFVYRFSGAPGVHVYALRARAARQPGFAFATGVSRAVTVRVRG